MKVSIENLVKNYKRNRIVMEKVTGSTFALYTILKNEKDEEKLAVIEKIIENYVELLETFKSGVYEIYNNIPSGLSFKLFELAQKYDNNFMSKITTSIEIDQIKELEKLN